MVSQRPNRLANAKSFYLRQHRDNPVDWYPWGPEAFAKAQGEDKPIFLSIGYATCHWCHVMARESFSDPTIAQFLNEHFVAIKVDRQELPQVDDLYMRAAIALGSPGGWPLSVFCTPEGLPFFAGTYFPPESRPGLPSFREILERVLSFWRSRKGELLAQREVLVSLFASPSPKAATLDVQSLTSAALSELERDFDVMHGGFGRAPKFPLPAQLAFLLHLARHGNGQARAMLTKTLDGMAQGGIRDVLFGGFHRYSTDQAWFLPHFEKMLPDNALLAQLYLEAGILLRSPRWRQVAQHARHFLRALYRTSMSEDAATPGEGQRLTHPFFAAGWDAETQEEEGRPFTFTWTELTTLLSQEEQTFIRLLTPFPWFHGPRPLALRPLDRTVANELGVPLRQAQAVLGRILERLRTHAASKGLPQVDEQAVSAWNALAVVALCHWARRTGWTVGGGQGEGAERKATWERASYLTHEAPRSSSEGPWGCDPTALAVAEGLWQFRWETTGSVPRTVYRGVPQSPETLEDLAWVATAFVEVFLTTGATLWLERAVALLQHRLPHYLGKQGELFQTPDDQSVFPIRSRNTYDGAQPNPGAVLCQTLYTLWWLTGNRTFANWADAAVAAEATLLGRSPANATSWLVAAEKGVSTSVLVIAGAPQWTSTRDLVRAALQHPQKPDLVVFLDHWPPSEEDLATLPIFQNRPEAGHGQALAYFCRGTVCLPPVGTATDLRRLLGDGTHEEFFAGHPR